MPNSDSKQPSAPQTSTTTRPATPMAQPPRRRRFPHPRHPFAPRTAPLGGVRRDFRWVSSGGRDSYHPSQANLPQTPLDPSRWTAPEIAPRTAPVGRRGSGGAGAPPGEPDEALPWGTSEEVEVDRSGGVLPVVPLVVRLRAQHEVPGVDAQPVVAAVSHHLIPPDDRRVQHAQHEPVGVGLATPKDHLGGSDGVGDDATGLGAPPLRDDGEGFCASTAECSLSGQASRSFCSALS
jgi:hypothetical protein